MFGDLDLKYKGSEFEFLTIDIASKIAEEGSFILPQQSTPFKYSGERNYNEVQPISKLSKFLKETGFEMQLPIGIDTSVYLNDWNGVSPMCEVVDIDFTQVYKVSTSPEEINLFNY